MAKKVSFKKNKPNECSRSFIGKCWSTGLILLVFRGGIFIECFYTCTPLSKLGWSSTSQLSSSTFVESNAPGNFWNIVHHHIQCARFLPSTWFICFVCWCQCVGNWSFWHFFEYENWSRFLKLSFQRHAAGRNDWFSRHQNFYHLKQNYQFPIVSGKQFVILHFQVLIHNRSRWSLTLNPYLYPLQCP